MTMSSKIKSSFAEQPLSLKVAVCQCNSTDSLELNIESIVRQMTEASEAGARISFFPENSLYMRIVEGEKIPGFSLTHDVFKTLGKLAASLELNVHLGSVPLWMGAELFNSSVFISSAGEVRPTYQKLHLFDILLEGQPPIKESDVFSFGQKPQIIDICDWSFGQTICYDIRFSELFHHYAKLQADVILVPSAFLVTTGRDHWEVLLRARAIESQCYILAPAQAGVHRGQAGGTRETYGRSMIIDPWGRVVAEAGTSGPQVLVWELQRQKLDQVRRQIPMKDHRRL